MAGNSTVICTDSRVPVAIASSADDPLNHPFLGRSSFRRGNATFFLPDPPFYATVC